MVSYHDRLKLQKSDRPLQNVYSSDLRCVEFDQIGSIEITAMLQAYLRGTGLPVLVGHREHSEGTGWSTSKREGVQENVRAYGFS